MKVAGLLILMLSNQAYWTGGEPASVIVDWAAPQTAPAAELRWQLMIGNVAVASGAARLTLSDAASQAATQPAVPPATHPLAQAVGGAPPTQPALPASAAARHSAATIHLTAGPAVRARTPARFIYVIKSGQGAELQRGELPLFLFPRNEVLTSDWKRLLKTRQLIVCDKAEGGLGRLLTNAGVNFLRMDVHNLQQAPAADVLLVAADQLDNSFNVQAPLLALARNGCSVMTFQQHEPRMLGPWPVQPRRAVAALHWEAGHRLFAGLGEDDLKSWLLPFTALPCESSPLPVMQVPADAAAVPLASWLRENGSDQAAPNDALALTQNVGKGRLVFFQVPLGAWETDPRSVLLMGNALDYLLSPPQTLPATQGPAMKKDATPSIPRITIPFGDPS